MKNIIKYINGQKSATQGQLFLHASVRVCPGDYKLMKRSSQQVDLVRPSFQNQDVKSLRSQKGANKAQIPSSKFGCYGSIYCDGTVTG